MARRVRCSIFQFQSDISRLDWVGDIGATALVTVKAQADDLDTAMRCWPWPHRDG